jgi:hypothetical protein
MLKKPCESEQRPRVSLLITERLLPNQSTAAATPTGLRPREPHENFLIGFASGIGCTLTGSPSFGGFVPPDAKGKCCLATLSGSASLIVETSTASDWCDLQAL